MAFPRAILVVSGVDAVLSNYGVRGAPAEEENMEQNKPPPWPEDPLSTFMADVDLNSRATAFNLPEIYALLQRVHATFLRVGEAVESGTHASLVPGILRIRAHSSFLAATRLSTSGQLLEAFVVLRVAIEQAWYALHIAKDPTGHTRAEILLRRDEDERRCAQEFSIGNVRRTHEAHDPATAKDLHRLYRWLIDFGAHPNAMGLLRGLTKTEAERTALYSVPMLSTDMVPLVNALQKVVAVAVGILKVNLLIHSDRFKLAGLDQEIDRLVADGNRIFARYSLPATPDPGPPGDTLENMD